MSAPTLSQTTKASELVPYYAEQIKGKIVLVTGVAPNSLGDGFATSIAAGKPSVLILAGRNPSKFQSVTDKIREAHPEVTVKPLTLDLASFASVRSAAQLINDDAAVPHIDVLMLNAGIMAVPFSLTEDGFESQFQVCHLGHFLLANLVMDKVLASPGVPRIITVSSTGHVLGPVRWVDHNFDGGACYDRWAAYGQAKSANNLMAVGLASRLGRRGKGLYAFSLHPGMIMSTGLGPLATGDEPVDEFLETLHRAFERVGAKYMKDLPFVKDADQGVATHVFAAFDAEVARQQLNGSHLTDCRVASVEDEEVYPHSIHEAYADKLWKLSEELVGQKFDY